MLYINILQPRNIRMANFFPSLEVIDQLTVKPTEGESFLLNKLAEELDDTFDVYFNPYLDGDRPDFLILKKGLVIYYGIKFRFLSGRRTSCDYCND